MLYRKVLDKFPKLCTKGVRFLLEHEHSDLHTILEDRRMTLERHFLYASALGRSRLILKYMLDDILTKIVLPRKYDISDCKNNIKYSTISKMKANIECDWSKEVEFTETWNSQFFQKIAILSIFLGSDVEQHREFLIGVCSTTHDNVLSSGVVHSGGDRRL